MPLTSVTLQSDGRILIGGTFTYPGQLRGLLRLNPDGSPDTAFNNSAPLNTVTETAEILVYPDNKIVFSGKRVINNQTVNTFMRVNANGVSKAEIGSFIRRMILQPDGKIIGFRSDFVFARYNSDLSLDGTFQASVTGCFNDFALQADGKIVVGGCFTEINGFPAFRVTRCK